MKRPVKQTVLIKLFPEDSLALADIKIHLIKSEKNVHPNSSATIRYIIHEYRNMLKKETGE